MQDNIMPQNRWNRFILSSRDYGFSNQIKDIFNQKSDKTIFFIYSIFSMLKKYLLW